MTITTERPASSETGTDFAAARRAMIDSQLRVSGVTQDFVVAAMGKLPREDFVPENARGHAYIDRAIPLGDGHALPAPLVHGLLLREAAPKPDDTALLVECGAGYLAALLGPLVGTLAVVSPADGATKKGKGAYSLIVIEGAIEQVPTALAAQLAEGGRLVTGITERGVTRLVQGRKVAGQLALQPLAEIGIPVLAEFAAPRSWSF